MAIGDAAVAAGIPIMTGSELANTLDTEMNKTRDEIARRTNAVTPVAKGGTGATTPAAARAALTVPEAGTVGGKAVMDISGTGDLGFGWNGRRFSGRKAATEYELAHLADVIAVESTANAAQGTANAAKDGLLNGSVYARVIGGSYRVCYVAADGTLGWVSSSRTAKEDIETAPIDVQAVLAMEVVTYHRIGSPEGTLEHGLIAEELHALGLTWLVDYGPEGDTPQGVRYDLIALALIPAIRSAHARIDAIETHLDAVGGQF